MKSRVHCRHGDHVWEEWDVWDYDYAGYREYTRFCEVCSELDLKTEDIPRKNPKRIPVGLVILNFLFSIWSLYMFALLLVGGEVYGAAAFAVMFVVSVVVGRLAW